MKTILTGVLMTWALLSTAQGEQQKLEPFDHIEVRGDIQVYLYKGEEGEGMMAEAMSEDLPMDKLLFEQDGDRLLIKIKGDFFGERDVQVKVTYNKLRTIVARQKAEVRLKDTIQVDKLLLESKSGGKILADVVTSSIEMSVDAGGSIRVLGLTDYAEASVSAGGTIACAKLFAKRAKANVKAGGDIIIRFEDSLEAKVFSGGNISYLGDANKVDAKTSIGGKIEKIEE